MMPGDVQFYIGFELHKLMFGSVNVTRIVNKHRLEGSNVFHVFKRSTVEDMKKK